MSNTIQAQVMALLEAYPDTVRKIAVYRYELEHMASVTPNEVIGSMNFTHSDGIGAVTGHISNKTAYIAMHYQEKAAALTEEATGDLAVRLWDMEQKLDRLHFYVSLMPPRQRKVLRLHYFAGKTRDNCSRFPPVHTIKTVSKASSCCAGCIKMPPRSKSRNYAPVTHLLRRKMLNSGAQRT